MKKFRLVVSIAALLLSAMVCDPTKKPSAIEANCSPSNFHLYPEASTDWTVEIQSDKDYEITVRSEDITKHPNNWIQIVVTDEGYNLLGNMPTYTSEAVFLNVVSPQNATKMNIAVSSLLGDGNEDLGSFTLTVCAAHEVGA